MALQRICIPVPTGFERYGIPWISAGVCHAPWPLGLLNRDDKLEKVSPKCRDSVGDVGWTHLEQGLPRSRHLFGGPHNLSRGPLIMVCTSCKGQFSDEHKMIRGMKLETHKVKRSSACLGCIVPQDASFRILPAVTSPARTAAPTS